MAKASSVTDFRSNFNQRWPLWLLCFALSPLLVNRYAPEFMDADTVMQALMSTQRVTLFFWGQDRYANVLPLLLSPIADPMWSLRLHLLVNAAAFFLFLEAVSHVLSLAWTKPPTLQRRLLLFSLPFGLALCLLRPFALYQFCVSAQPYALSMTLLIWAALVYQQRFVGRALLIASAVLLFVSIGLNPANLLIVLALFAFSVWTGTPREWRGFVVIATVSFGAWTVLSATNPVHAPSSYLAFGGFRALVGSLKRSLLNLGDVALRVRYVVGVIGVLLVAALALGPPKLPNKLRRALLFSIAFSMAWWLFFLCNRWVQDNGSPFRYFFPLFFAPIVAITVWIVGYLEDRHFARGAVAIAGVCLCAFAVWASRPWTPLAEYKALAAVAEPLKDAKSMHIHYFAGDYWLGWPMVFALRAENVQAFGVFDRGIALRDRMLGALRGELRRGQRPLAMCIGTPISTCQEQLLEATGGHWSGPQAPSLAQGSVLRMDSAPP